MVLHAWAAGARPTTFQFSMHAAQVGDVYLEFLEASHAMLCYKALPAMGRKVIYSPLYIFPW